MLADRAGGGEGEVWVWWPLRAAYNNVLARRGPAVMASFVQPGVDTDGPGYRGRAEMFAFTNGDGCRPRTNCGQAACATFLTHHGRWPEATRGAARLMEEIEGRFPPDIFGGLCGTSRKQVTRTCRAFGLTLEVIGGEAALREQLATGNPILVMLGVPLRLW